MIRNKTIQENLLKTVIFLANEGVTEFLSGGYGNFDILVAETVKAIKENYPYVISTLVIPYMDKEVSTNLYDGSVYPPIETVPKRAAIIKRNMWMVDNSDVVVGYITNVTGGAFKTYDYALKRKKQTINLHEFDECNITEKDIINALHSKN